MGSERGGASRLNLRGFCNWHREVSLGAVFPIYPMTGKATKHADRRMEQTFLALQIFQPIAHSEP